MQTSHKLGVTLLVIFWDFGIGGVQKKMTDIAAYAAVSEGKGLRLHFILRDKPSFRFDTEQTLQPAIVHYRPVFGNAFIHVPFSLYCFWQIFKNRPETVLTFLDHASWITIISAKILFWRKIRIVLNEDTFTSSHTTSPIKRLLVSLLYPRADLIISPTMASRENLIRAFRIPASLITVIPNWTMARVSKQQRKTTYDLLYIGRFAQQKNIVFLLNAVKHMLPEKKNVSLCLVGEGPEKPLILHRIRELGLTTNVSIFPSSHTVGDYFRQSTIFVLSSWYEGMPVALLEAMTAGVAVVTTNFPGVSEYITHGTTGLIARTEKEFAAHICTLLSNDTYRETLQNNAKKDVQRRFSHTTLQWYIKTVLQDKA